MSFLERLFVGLGRLVLLAAYRYRLLFVGVLVGLALVAIIDAIIEGPPPIPRWHTLRTQTIALGAGSGTLRLENNSVRSGAIQLTIKDGTLALTRVIIKYTNGHVH